MTGTDGGGGNGLRSTMAPHLNRRNAVLVLVSIALLLMVIAVQQITPNTDDDSNAFAPSFKVVGQLGKPVELRDGTLTLSHARLARSVRESSSFGKPKPAVRTPGVWVLVDYKFIPKRKRESLDAKLISSDHASYRTSPRAGGGLSGSISGPPGLTQKGTFAFEVPKGVLAGSSFTVGADSPYSDALWDTKAVVSLGIDRGRVHRLIEHAPAAVTLRS